MTELEQEGPMDTRSTVAAPGIEAITLQHECQLEIQVLQSVK